MSIRLDRRAGLGNEQTLECQCREVIDQLRGPAGGAGNGVAGCLSDVLEPTSDVGRLRLDKRFTVKDTIAVENTAAFVNELVEAKIVGTVEIPEVGLFKPLECLNWICHANLSPVRARASRA